MFYKHILTLFSDFPISINQESFEGEGENKTNHPLGQNPI
jgi:hypothetical protein